MVRLAGAERLTGGFMEGFERLIADSEDVLVAGVSERAGEQGYGQFLPAPDESYRAEVAMLSANLLQALAVEGELKPLRADTDVRTDPVASLGARMARGRGLHGHDAALLLGLLKCYRGTYLWLLEQSGLPRDEHAECVRAIARFFDRVETGVISARTAIPEQRSVALAADGRDRYLAAFASLPFPALLIDPRGRLEQINAAASVLFEGPEAARSRELASASDRRAAPVFADEIEAFRTSPEQEISFEREAPTSKGTRYFQARFTKAPATPGAAAGVLVVLSDITYRRNAEEALRRSQNEYAALFEHMPIGFVHTRVLLDRRNRPADHTVLEVNPAFERLSGVSASELVGRPFTEVLDRVGASGSGWMDALGRTALTGEPTTFDARLGSGGVWVSASAFSPSPGHVALMLSDITGAKQIEGSLARSRDTYLSLLDGLPSLVWRAGPTGNVDYVNEAWSSFTGVGSGDPEESWREAVHPADRVRRRVALEAAARDRAPFEIGYRLRTAAGDYHWVEEHGRPFDGLDGSFAGLIGTTVDVNDRIEREETLESMATTDPLTGLVIGKVFEESLQRSVAQAERGSTAALVVADVDGFSALNQRAGKAAADECLRQLASVLRALVRSGDLVGRIGADSFGVLLPSAGVEAGEGAARRLLAAVRSIAEPDVEPFSVSVGVAAVTGETAARELLGRVGAAALAAGSAGGDRIAVVDVERDRLEVRDGQGMAALVASALAAGEGVRVLYQPAYRIADGGVEYCEALVRLEDGEGALLEPASFLQDAARAGLMPRLGRTVIRTAVDDMARVPTSRVAVNVSIEVLGDATLLEEVAGLMRDAGVAAHRLTFELSEDAALRRLTDAQAFADRARELGFGVALDHVGRSARAFTHLQNIAVDRITIDGGVVSSLLGNPRQARLITSIQAVAGAMGMRTCAQWIEDDETLAMVRDAGVVLAQGRHLGAPVDGLVCGADKEWPSRFPPRRKPHAS